MPDGKPPELPATAPIELREFIECKRASVTISSGPLDWLPLPPDIKDYAPTPKLDLTPGASPGTGTMTIDLMITSFALPVSVVGGDLQIDAGGLSSIPGAQEAIDTWTKDFNDWLKRNGQRLKQATIAGGSVTLVKEPIPAPPPGVAPPPPTPPVAPVAPTPPAGNANNTGCWLLGLLALLVVAVIGVGGVTGFLPIPGLGGGGPTVSVGPTASGATVTGPSVTAVASTAAQASTTARPSTSTGPVTPPSPEEVIPALDFLREYAGLSDAARSKVAVKTDPARDMYFPQPGQTPGQYFAESDLTAAAGFLWTLTPETAAAITAAARCATDAVLDAVKYRSACNQDRPLDPGEYVMVIVAMAGGFPGEFPTPGIHSWAVSTNPDDDLATGFTSSAEDNYLIGADTFLEVVAFTDASGTLSYYVLATRMSDPVRADTGQRQGNLPTIARTIWFFEDGVLLWIIPAEDFGPNWYAGNFASLNRGANSPANLAADALLGPDDAAWLDYLVLEGILQP